MKTIRPATKKERRQLLRALRRQKLSEWLRRNDIGRIEFVLYILMSALAVIWLFAALWRTFTT